MPLAIICSDTSRDIYKKIVMIIIISTITDNVTLSYSQAITILVGLAVELVACLNNAKNRWLLLIYHLLLPAQVDKGTDTVSVDSDALEDFIVNLENYLAEISWDPEVKVSSYFFNILQITSWLFNVVSFHNTFIPLELDEIWPGFVTRYYFIFRTWEIMSTWFWKEQ